MSVMVLSNDQHMRENMWLILRKLMTINNGNDVGGEKLLLLVEKWSSKFTLDIDVVGFQKPRNKSTCSSTYEHMLKIL